MGVNPLELLRIFADFAEVGRDVVNQFAEARPDLIMPGDDDAPRRSPPDDIDPEVRREIERGDL